MVYDRILEFIFGTELRVKLCCYNELFIDQNADFILCLLFFLYCE